MEMRRTSPLPINTSYRGGWGPCELVDEDEVWQRWKSGSGASHKFHREEGGMTMAGSPPLLPWEEKKVGDAKKSHGGWGPCELEDAESIMGRITDERLRSPRSRSPRREQKSPLPSTAEVAAAAAPAVSSSSVASPDTSVMKLFDLTGRVALVTGGTGWLGTALPQALAEANGTVVVTSRDKTRAQEAANALPGGPHFGVAMDQEDVTSIHDGFAEAVELAGKVDVVVNNGQNMAMFKTHGDINTVAFEDFVQAQLMSAGYFELSRRLRDHCVERGAPGCVVNLGSMYGQVASYPEVYNKGGANPVSYQCLKGGVLQMTRHCAAYWAQDQIRVNSLSPGPFPQAGAPAYLREKLSEKVPLRRMGQPHELKGALLLLCSDAGSFMTGTNINVDGGWTAV